MVKVQNCRAQILLRMNEQLPVEFVCPSIYGPSSSLISTQSCQNFFDVEQQGCVSTKGQGLFPRSVLRGPIIMI